MPWTSSVLAVLLTALLGTATLGMLAPRPAWAHGRFPETGEIAFHPSDPDTILVRTTFGLLLTRNGGTSWGWVCQQAVGVRESTDPAVTFTSDGAILAATFEGLRRGTDGGCAWAWPDPDLSSRIVIDLARHPTDPDTTFALTSDGNRPNGVFVTRDGGLAWDATNAEVDSLLFETIEVAPSAPDRIYLTGANAPGAGMPRLPNLYRSSDGGVTWETLPFGDQFGEEGDRNAYLLGVDPTEADRLLAYVLNEGEDRLLRSTDGGETWDVAWRSPAITSAAFSDDGATVWVGDDEGGGLARSTDGGETFEVLREDLEIGCLTTRDGELWACGNNFESFGIGRSADGGQTFENLLVFKTGIEGLISCGEDAEIATACEAELVDLRADLGVGETPGDAGDAGDAGTAGTAGGGGGCAAAPVRKSTPVLASLPAGALCLILRRRWARHRHRR